ncbi:Fungal Zn2-Cys6 binuclear cluster domain-containing protein isoform 2 [Cladophialophora immunda]|nr:Fungal Zn2-Cys6 binuclear cluster domain-containing protein isoform 1 [Cladophialophora immunda]OQV01643.1 Fungal Zn2-Cys6 binuclear cluster domain-containing protein isoform 2 [Cladophialophora immunda]
MSERRFIQVEPGKVVQRSCDQCSKGHRKCKNKTQGGKCENCERKGDACSNEVGDRAAVVAQWDSTHRPSVAEGGPSAVDGPPAADFTAPQLEQDQALAAAERTYHEPSWQAGQGSYIHPPFSFDQDSYMHANPGDLGGDAYAGHVNYQPGFVDTARYPLDPRLLAINGHGAPVETQAHPVGSSTPPEAGVRIEPTIAEDEEAGGTKRDEEEEEEEGE